MPLAILLAILLLGFVNGLRTMTPIAVLCWFAYLGYLPVKGTWAFWTALVPSLAMFTLFAVGEYIGDKLPQTPNRTAPPLLLARLAFGGLIGSIIATAIKAPLIEGILLGMVGAALGTYGGIAARTGLVRRLRCADWNVAVAEDIFGLLCAVFAMHLITR